MLEKERERHPRDKRDSASESQKNEKKKRAWKKSRCRSRWREDKYVDQ